MSLPTASDDHSYCQASDCEGCHNEPGGASDRVRPVLISRSNRIRRRECKVGAQSGFPQSLHSFLLHLLLCLLTISTVVDAVEDGTMEPVSIVKWMYGIGGVFFVFIMMPPGIFGGREGIDPVIAFTICWTIIGCWTLRGIAN